MQQFVWNNTATWYETHLRFPVATQAGFHPHPAGRMLSRLPPCSCLPCLRGGSGDRTDSVTAVTNGENSTFEMYSWNGQLLALRTVEGQPDTLIDTSDNSHLWDRKKNPQSMLQHILAQASRTQRTTPFTFLSAPTSSPDHTAESKLRRTSDGTDAHDKEAALAANLAKLSVIDDNEGPEEEDEDTEAELQRTLDEVRLDLHPDSNSTMLRMRLTETASLRMNLSIHRA
jgi:hypothetical protein